MIIISSNTKKAVISFSFVGQAFLGQKPEAEFSISWAAVAYFSTLNHAINFILYVISGQQFRRQLMVILFCRKQGDGSVMRNTTSHSVSYVTKVKLITFTFLTKFSKILHF